ncbi:LexA family protein [Methylobacterium iners]|uniref:LexA repressor n=1 Tax=Methylobacterium iners TaxID=418707 RepID=A0ABQ4S5I0_9HYPH|nr:hypothetical protein [Methylobacterium iners]GJD97744.1 LexA repressor [Methylobacterium iners]
MTAPVALRPKLTLTARQRDLLDFIKQRLAAGLAAPSYEEMSEHLGVSSKSNIFRLIQALVDRGHLYEMPRSRARAIALVPDGAQAPRAASVPVAPPVSPPNLPPRPGLVRVRKVDQATGTASVTYAVRLPTALANELLDHCQIHQATPNDVVITAIVRHLRGRS